MVILCSRLKVRLTALVRASGVIIGRIYSLLALCLGLILLLLLFALQQIKLYEAVKLGETV
jgi:hypothetical protein